MSTGPQTFSDDFQRLYCDPAAFEGFSALCPVSFARVLPFQAQDSVVDNPDLLAAELAHLAERNNQTRRAVVEAFARSGLLPEAEAVALIPVVDIFDADFFEFMGETYANAGGHICALRWYREFIAEIETQISSPPSDSESVYANVGYGLYSLGLFAEAIAWSERFIGPAQMADSTCRALIAYEAQLAGGELYGVERSGARTRYTITAVSPPEAALATPRLKEAMRSIAPFQEIYIDWISKRPAPEIPAGAYPFQPELDGGNLLRHRLNLIFALCGEADALAANRHFAEAKRLLHEAALLEPNAEFIQERIRLLP